ncbi:MAG: endopeptidase La [Deltaproteobacteria bacterium]|nr:endopeptidase La [Deltaproteobacteria bacterium]
MVRLSNSNPSNISEIPGELFVLPTKDYVIFPAMVLPIFFTREDAIEVVNKALLGDHMVVMVAQKEPSVETPSPDDLYMVGTATKIIQMVKLPEGGVKILVEGIARVKIVEYFREGTHLKAKVEEMREFYERTIIVDALVQSVIALFKVALAIGRPLPVDVLKLIDKIENPARLSDLIAAYLALKLEEQQEILETVDPLERIKKVFIFLSREVQMLQIRGKIQTDVAKEMGKSQKEYLLRQQMKAIQKELGEEDSHIAETNELREKIKAAGMLPNVEEIANKELSRLEKMNPASAEYTVSLTYLDYLITLPWTKKTEDNLDINRAEQILNEDHYDLEKVKDRILEYLAVRKIKEGVKGPILCFVGPPGVGKTSLGKSIARAMDRKFIRMSLGGMRDEAEIRGHRRTYVGALPGRIIQEIRRCGYNNPVFMLDEVDKIGMDFRGDPAAALLEVLDPEQNFSFRDHYLDVSFDLSKVMFITTANILDPVPPALKDRMEVIYLSGYTEEEKEKIAFQFLIPKQTEENGLKDKGVNFTEEAVRKIIREYTKEAGLRNLEREIASICRKIARNMAQGKGVCCDVTPEIVEEFLGPRKFFVEIAEETDTIGVATGLAWTEAGGDIIFVEATKMKGRRGLTLTGSLGEVMKESAQAAMSYMRTHAKEYEISEDFFNRFDIHIHVPAGAIPKDGPSAGVTMATAIASLLTGRPAKRDVAMTGEITLSGRVLPIGGVKEKVLAARRAGVKTVILPKRNEVNMEDVPDYVRKEMKFIFVKTIDEVIKLALK